MSARTEALLPPPPAREAAARHRHTSRTEPRVGGDWCERQDLEGELDIGRRPFDDRHPLASGNSRIEADLDLQRGRRLALRARDAVEGETGVERRRREVDRDVDVACEAALDREHEPDGRAVQRQQDRGSEGAGEAIDEISGRGEVADVVDRVLDRLRDA